MNNKRPNGNPGIYIHIPFCAKKCRYCDFYSCTELDLIDSFVAALQQETYSAYSGDILLNWRDASDAPKYSGQLSKMSPECSLYIGGGTPSVLPADKIAEIIETATTQFNLLPDAEITVEVNPDSVSRNWLKTIGDAGVNRVNIGIQSFNDDYLNWLGRIHSADQAIKAIEAARETGFTNIGIDIIYGLTGQTEKQLKQDLEQALIFSPEHLSCYMLTYEPGTPLTLDLENRRFEQLPDEQAADLFIAVSHILQEHGYEHYEISNFTRSKELRSRHNQKYWHRAPYIGLGPGAHSYDGAKRFWNPPDVDAYISALSNNCPLKPEQESLSREQHMTESIYLGLRLAEGIDIPSFNREFDVDFEELFRAAIDIWTSTGHLKISPANCALTLSGWLFHETISADFAADL